MIRLYPPANDKHLAQMTPAELAEVYAYPITESAPYVRTNLVTSINGITTVDGLSGGLSSPDDLTLFKLLRGLADVILVGAATARMEDYRGARIPKAVQKVRRERGQQPVPPIAVVTARADIDPESRLLKDTSVPPLIFTTDAAPPEHLDRLAAAGAKITISGRESADPRRVLQALADSDLNRVLCEGGPNMLGQLIAEDAIDEYCITVSTRLVGGSTGLTAGPETPPHKMNLDSIIRGDEGLFFKYSRH
ncbi:pyrimidine reductase family protein [Micromonospora sp. FIMYZ51]|uniref:pyrimidine reductase family protein n=1 Tax=Micromonospora sp. FIMYZ51 TaxID=3051832 RepID=UPI00311DF1D6